MSKKNKRNKESTEIILGESTDTATLIFSHGLGDSPTSWIFFANEIKRFVKNIRVILLSAPNNPVSVNNGLEMPSWFDILEIPITMQALDNGKYMDESINIIHKIIDSEIETGISPNRIFVGGFSQGATLSLIATLKYTKVKLGGVAMLSGWIFKNHNLSKLSNIPVFIGHGDKDKVVLYENAKNLESILKASKFSDITFKTYNNMGHNSSTKEIDDLIFWINKLNNSNSNSNSNS